MGAEADEAVKGLFTPKWDREVLDALAERPHRFGELNVRIQAVTGTPFHDSTQTRTLSRLRGQGLIGFTPVYEGRRRIRLYHLTPAGARIVNARWAVLAAYESAMSAGQRCVAACPWNDTPLLKKVARPYPDIGPADTTTLSSPSTNAEGGYR
jgi:DNA-binding HxlR family transcriptional regulator